MFWEGREFLKKVPALNGPVDRRKRTDLHHYARRFAQQQISTRFELALPRAFPILDPL